MYKSNQMKLAEWVCLFVRIFITQYKYQIITQIHTNVHYQNIPVETSRKTFHVAFFAK